MRRLIVQLSGCRLERFLHEDLLLLVPGLNARSFCKGWLEWHDFAKCCSCYILRQSLTVGQVQAAVLWHRNVTIAAGTAHLDLAMLLAGERAVYVKLDDRVELARLLQDL